MQAVKNLQQRFFLKKIKGPFTAFCFFFLKRPCERFLDVRAYDFRYFFFQMGKKLQAKKVFLDFHCKRSKK